MTFKLRNESIVGFMLFIPSITRIMLVTLGVEFSSHILSATLYSIAFLLAILSNNKIHSLNIAKILHVIFMLDVCHWIYTFTVNIGTSTNLNIPVLMFAQHCLMVLPVFWIVSNIKCLKQYDDAVKKFARYVATTMLLLYFTKGTVTHMESYDMSLGYSLVLVGVILLTSFFKDRSKLNLFLSITVLGLALKFGSRGIILVYVTSLLINLFYCSFRVRMYSILACILGALVMYVAYIFGWFEDSRTINLVFNTDKLLYLSGRDRIFDQLQPYFFNAPLFGNGLGFDRITTNSYGLYAHNIVLESLVNNGLFITIILMSFLLLILYKDFTKLKKYYSEVVISLISMQVQMLISSSYVTDVYFWSFVGISLCFLNTKNKED